MSPDESNAVIQRNGEIVVMTIDEVRAEIVSQYGVWPTDRYCEAVLASDLNSTEP